MLLKDRQNLEAEKTGGGGGAGARENSGRKGYGRDKGGKRESNTKR